MQQLLQLAFTDLATWRNLLGLYIHHSGRSPGAIGLRGLFCRDYRWVDLLDKDKKAVPTWPMPVEGSVLDIVIRQVRGSDMKREMLEEAMRRWEMISHEDMTFILKNAGWINWLNPTEEWNIMDQILRMDEGPEKQRLIAQARLELPKFVKNCLEDHLCGR